MALVDSLAEALAQFEGFFQPGSRAARNNNPGNLRDSGGTIWPQYPHDSGGFVIFPSASDGWDSLRRQVALDMGRGLTLRQFLYKYAPPSDNNPTENYVAYVAGRVGIQSDIPLATLAASSGGARPSSPIPLGSSWWESDDALFAAGAVGTAALLALVV